MSAASAQNGSASSSPRRHGPLRSCAGTCLIDILVQLRRLDLWLPVSDALGFLGAVLLVFGVLCGFMRLFAEHPYLLATFAGLVCLVISALASHRGLVRFIPQGMQDKLFRRTPFDLLTQESKVTNIIRRWVRVFLLCQEDSEQEIQTIMKGLDPEFLDKVFRQCSLEMLPYGLRRLLLPTDAYNGDPLPLQRLPAWQASRRGAARTAGVGSLMSRCVGVVPRRKVSQDEAEVLSPSGIRELLLEKKEAKRSAEQEPSLTPVLRSWVFKLVSINTLTDAIVSHVAQQGAQLATAGAGLAALLWSGAGLFFCTPRARRALSGLAFSADSQAVEATAGRMALTATTCCVLGAAASSGLTFYAYRNWMGVNRRVAHPKDVIKAAVSCALGPEPLVGTRRSSAMRPEPEIEESPENSATEFSPTRSLRSLS